MKIRAEKFVQGGRALAHLDGRAVFINGAIPGELLEVGITSSKKDYAEGRILEVLEPSADRVLPVCGKCEECGGCDFMYLSYDAQLKAKEEILRDDFRRFAEIENDGLFQPIAHKNPLGYRSRARFSADGEAVGFRAASSKRVVPIGSCPVLTDELNAILKTLKPNPKREIPVQGGLSDGKVFVKGRAIHTGNDVFFQSNIPMLEELLEFVIPEIRGERVMDLYSGVGVFAAFAEDAGCAVTAVEREKRCLSYARRNLKKSKFFTEAAENWFSGERVDTVIVDPPRVGLERMVPVQIASWGPKRVIYVSCNPATLARDVAFFRLSGYSPIAVKPFDFYPQTSHLETVAILEK